MAYLINPRARLQASADRRVLQNPRLRQTTAPVTIQSPNPDPYASQYPDPTAATGMAVSAANQGQGVLPPPMRTVARPASVLNPAAFMAPPAPAPTPTAAPSAALLGYQDAVQRQQPRPGTVDTAPGLIDVPIGGDQHEPQYETVTVNGTEVWTAEDEATYQAVIGGGNAEQAVPLANYLGTTLSRIDPAANPEEVAFLAERLDALRTLAGTLSDPVAGATATALGAAQGAATAIGGYFAGGGVQNAGQRIGETTTETAQAVTRPAAEVATGDTSSIGGPARTVLDVGEQVLNAFDVPRQIVVGGQIPGTDVTVPSLGELGYRMATDPESWSDADRQAIQTWNNLLTVSGVSLPITDFLAWSMNPANAGRIQDAYTNGYGEFDGARAVWELYAGDQQGLSGMVQRVLNDVVFDPTSWTDVLAGFGARAIKGGTALRDVESLGPLGNALTSILGIGAQATGQAARLPYNVTDRPLESIVGGIARLGNRVGDVLAPLTPEGQLARDASRFTEVASDVLTREPTEVPPQPPPATVVTGPTTPPDVTPVETAPQPPPATIAPPATTAPTTTAPQPPPATARSRAVEPAASSATTPPVMNVPVPPSATVLDQATVAQHLIDETGATYRTRIGDTLTPEPLPDGGVRVVARDSGGRQLGDPIDYDTPEAAAAGIVEMAGPQPQVVEPPSALDAIERTRRAIEQAPPAATEGAMPTYGVDLETRSAPDEVTMAGVTSTPVEPRPPTTPQEAPPAAEQPPGRIAPEPARTEAPTPPQGPSTVPRTAAEREALPRELRPDRAGSRTVDRVARENPAAFRRFADEVKPQAEALIPRLNEAKRAAFDRGDYSRMDEVLIEGEYFADVQDAARRVAGIEPDPIPLRRQMAEPGAPNRGEFNRPAEEPGRALERILVEPWDGQKVDRQVFHTNGMFADSPADIARLGPDGITSGQRYVQAVDAHARLRPEDLQSPEFQRAVRQAQEVNAALGEDAVPTKSAAMDTPPEPRPPVGARRPRRAPRQTLGIANLPEQQAQRMMGPVGRAFKRYFSLPDRTKGFARGGDVLRYTDPDAAGRRTLVSDVEARVFDDPKLVFQSGKYEGRSWWDVAQEVATAKRAEGAADPVSEAVAETVRLAAKDRGLGQREISMLGRAIDGYLAYIREVTMYTPVRTFDQPATQFFGNMVTMGLTGKGRAAAAAFNPITIAKRVVKNEPMGELDRLMARFEIGMPTVTGGLDPAMTTSGLRAGDRAGELATRRAAKKLLGKKLGTVAAYPVASQAVRDLAVKMDTIAREAVFTTEFRRLLKPAWRDLSAEVERVAARYNIPPEQVRGVMGRLGRNPVGPSDLYLELRAVARTAGASEGDAVRFAERGRRDWLNATGKIREAATGETKRLFFSGETRGGAEKLMRRTFLFSYFTMRQSALYAGQALKNPGLMASYVRAAHGLERERKKEGLPTYMRNFLSLPWDSPWGYRVFLNPVALLATYITFRDGQGGEEGSFWDDVKNAGFLNPALVAAAQLIGADPDSYLADYTGLRTILKPAMMLLNLARAQRILPDTIGTEPIFANPADRLLQWVRENASQAAEDAGIPGAQAVPAQDPGATERANFYYLMVSIAMEENGGDLAAAQETADGAIDAPDSPLFIETQNRWAAENGWEYAITNAGPLRVTDRPPLKDEVAAASDVVHGEEPTDRFQPPGTTTTYPGTTTPVTPLEPGQEADANQEAVLNTRQSATATPEARQLLADDNGWYEVGTPEGRQAIQTWNSIAYGTPEQAITVGGVTIQPNQLAGLESDRRREIADLWAQENSVDGQIQLQRDAQDRYLAGHPQYAEYRDWRGNVYDAEGGPVAYWESIAADNPNAARYLEEQRGRGLDQRGLENALTSPEAYLASEGVRSNVYDAAPADTNTGAYNPANVTVADQTAGTGGTSGGTKPQDPAGRIADDLAQYQQDMALVGGVLAASGIPMAAIDGGSPMARQAAENILAAYGLSLPSLSGDAESYVQWAGQQQGGDASIQAFLKWKGENDALITAMGLPFLLGMGDLSGFPTGGGSSSGGFGGSFGGLHSGGPRLRRDFFDTGFGGGGPLVGGSLGPRIRR